MIIILFLLLFAAPAWAVPTFDTSATASAVAVDTLGVSPTIGGGCSNTLLVAGTSWDSSTAVTLTGVAVGGPLALTSRGSVGDGDGNHTVNLSSRVGLAGAQTVTATFSAATAVVTLAASSYCGVDQVTPHGTVATNNGNDTPVTVDVTSNTGELVVDEIFSHSSVTVGASQTERENEAGDAFFFATSDEAGAATTTMSWTQSAGHYWGSVAIPLKAASAAAAVVRRKAIVFQ